MQDPGIAGAQQLDEKLECHRIRQNWFEVEGYVYYIYIHIILWLHTYSGTLRFHCWCWDTTKQIHTNPLYVLLKPIIINPSWKFNNSHQKISMFLLIYSMGFWCFVFFCCTSSIDPSIGHCLYDPGHWCVTPLQRDGHGDSWALMVMGAEGFHRYRGVPHMGDVQNGSKWMV